MIDNKSGIQFNARALIRTVLNFIVPLICFGACITLGFVVIYPYFKHRQEVNTTISEKKALKELLENKLSILNRLSDFKNVLNEDSQLVDKVLVPEANVPQLLDEVFQIATNTGLTVSRLNYSYGDLKGDSAPANTYREVNVSLGTDGNYDKLVSLLQDVEVAARVLYIPAFRYNTDQEGNLSMNFNVVSPFLSVQSTAVTDEPVKLDVTDPQFIEFMGKLKTLRYYEFLNKNIEVIEEEEAEEPAVPEAPKTP